MKIPTRHRPRLFRALGSHEPPATVEIDGATFTLMDCLKHDSWAATGLYTGPADKIVCKFNRQQSIFGFPMRWLGRMLAAREEDLLRRLADLPNLPRACGPVTVAGVVQAHAAAHRYIEGHPLRTDERVDDDFFPQLRATLDEMHRRGIAYGDLHKRENIIVGDDQRPYLIDFQICWRARKWFGWGLFHILRRGDDFHLLKHIIRHRPDLLPPDQRDITQHLPWFIRMYRHAVVNPFRMFRRRLLTLIGVRSGEGQAASEVAPEEAVRHERESRRTDAM